MQPRDLLRAGRDAKQPTVHSAALAHCALGCNCFQHLSVFFFLPRVRWSKQRGAACNLRRRPLRYRLLRTVAASRGVQREQGGLGTGMGCYLPEKLFSSMHGRAKTLPCMEERKSAGRHGKWSGMLSAENAEAGPFRTRFWPTVAWLCHSALTLGGGARMLCNEAWLTQVGDERQTRLGTHGDFSAPLTMMLAMCRGQMRCEMDRLH